MPVPVMTVVAAIRQELQLTAREAAGRLGIAHGFLQQTEEFEYVPAPAYRTASNAFFASTLQKFFENTLPFITPSPLSYVVRSLISHIPAALMNDAKFHALAAAHAFDDVFLSTSTASTAYGPLFSFVLGEAFEIGRDEQVVFLRAVGKDDIDYFLNFIMSRLWGHRAAQRRRHARSAGFVYKSLFKLDADDKDRDCLGYFEDCPDPREIFWLHPHYTARKSFLPYLFLYLVLTRLSFSFSLPQVEQKYRAPLVLHESPESGALFLKPAYCVAGPEACRSPFATCNVMTLICPFKKLVNFFWRPEGGGSFTHYCVKYAAED